MEAVSRRHFSSRTVLNTKLCNNRFPRSAHGPLTPLSQPPFPSPLVDPAQAAALDTIQQLPRSLPRLGFPYRYTFTHRLVCGPAADILYSLRSGQVMESTHIPSGQARTPGHSRLLRSGCPWTCATGRRRQRAAFL